MTIYFNKPPIHRRKSTWAAAASVAGGAALVATLGGGDGTAPEDTSPAPAASAPHTHRVATPHVSLPELTASAPSPAASASAACAPAFDPHARQELLDWAKYLWTSNTPDKPADFYQGAEQLLQRLTGQKKVGKDTIKLVPDEIFQAMGTTRMQFEAAFKRTALEAAHNTLEHVFSEDPVNPVGEARVRHWEIRKALNTLKQTDYPTLETALQAMPLQGRQVSLAEVQALQKTFRDKALADQLDYFKQAVSRMERAQNGEGNHRPAAVQLARSIQTIYDILDDGTKAPQQLDAEFRQLSQRDKSEFTGYIGQYYKTADLLKPEEQQPSMLHMFTFQAPSAASAPASGCWTDRVTQQQHPASAAQTAGSAAFSPFGR